MALKDKMSVGRKGEVVTSNATGGQEIPTPEVNTTTDPRSKILTNQEAPFNKIAVGEEVVVVVNLSKVDDFTADSVVVD